MGAYDPGVLLVLFMSLSACGFGAIAGLLELGNGKPRKSIGLIVAATVCIACAAALNVLFR